MTYNSVFLILVNMCFMHILFRLQPSLLYNDSAIQSIFLLPYTYETESMFLQVFLSFVRKSTLSQTSRKNYLRKFMIKVTITSFSSGRDSATINVIATRALLDITCFPSLYKALFLLRNSRKIEAPILLHPSANG